MMSNKIEEDLTLFSRSGKQTSYLHLCFNKNKNNKNDEGNNEGDLSLMQKKILKNLPKEVAFEKVKADL